jgi:hypothetical protein
MTLFMICIVYKLLIDDKTRKRNMDRVCIRRGKDEKGIQNI